jgi:hypothetical protein
MYQDIDIVILKARDISLIYLLYVRLISNYELIN